ncbi:MAG: uracil-DNA glycosylase [Pseudomonadota bacterium]
MSDIDHTTSLITAPQYAEAVLQWYLDNGVDETMLNTAQNRLARKAIAADVMPASAASSVIAPALPMPTAVESMAEALSLARSAHDLEELRKAILGFEGLVIRKTAMNMVFSDGNPLARVMVVGDVPESDEDRAGKAFMGAQGQFLDKMFAAIGLTRTAVEPERSLYLTHMLNWRPPGNRSPQQAEIDLSLPFLERHIALIAPKILVLMGPLVTKALQGGTVAKLRGGIGIYKPATADVGGVDISCVVMQPPASLLKAPLKKREAWADLLMIESALK